MSKIVCCHQANFFPYVGVFDKFRHSDIIMILDNDKYNKGTWFNRNKIKNARSSEAVWFTLPISLHQRLMKMKEVHISNDSSWRRKHYNVLKENYSKSPFFDLFFESIKKNIYEMGNTKLLDFNIRIYNFILRIYGFQCDIKLASSFDISEDLTLTDKLISLAKAAKGDVYLSGTSGKSYLESSKFKDFSLKIHSFRHPEYTQNGSGFVKNLSILDYLFNVGDKPWWE